MVCICSAFVPLLFRFCSAFASGRPLTTDQPKTKNKKAYDQILDHTLSEKLISQRLSLKVNTFSGNVTAF
jgi:hypothetical protein